MAKIYDALKRAEEERAGDRPDETPALPRVRHQGPSLRQKLIAVYRSIESGLPDTPCRVITFVAVRPGEGTSTLVRELAKLVSGELAQRVLLLDAACGSGGHHEHFGVRPEAGFEAVIAERRPPEDVIQPVEGGLHLGYLGTDEASAVRVMSSPEFQGIVKGLREAFRLVLFDAPAVTDSSSALLLVPQSDGVIMVVEAEKTRWQAAESARERIVMQGGNVLGVILNKRRFHIPRCVYRRL